VLLLNEMIIRLHICFVLFVSFLSNESHGQKKRTSLPNQIKIAPFGLVDFVNPRVEVSLERHFSANFSTQLSYGFMRDILGGGNNYSNYVGNRFGIEQKFFVRSADNSRPYFSLELLYSDVTYKKPEYFGYKAPGVDTFLYTYLDTIHLQRTTISFNLKAGRQFYVKRCVLEIAIGLGIKYRNTMHADRIAPFDEMFRPIHPNVYYEAERQGKSFIFNMPLNFRVGYLF
jgi:hypothetical protein